MLSLKNNKGAQSDKKQSKKIEREIPYFITIVTLLAESGFGPFAIFQKLTEITHLPALRLESIKILKRVDMLGIDPLTALNQAKDRQSSRALGEFLSGYVSAIQSGGNVISYLKSKMISAYERFENKERQSVEKLNGIVHAYLTLQVVMLAVYILLVSMGSTPLQGYLSTPTIVNSSQPPYVMLLLPTVMTVVFLIISKNFIYSSIPEIEIKKILRFAVPSVAVGAILILSNMFGMQSSPYILGASLIAAAAWPALKFKKIYATNIDAESATPQILRDITEARKAGIYPEKCIIHACKRTDYRTFNPIANAIASKLEWGIPVNDISDAVKNEINNFQVLITFRILFTVIFAGGGNANTLDTLADTSERIHSIEKNKRDMLKPHIVVGFMIVALTGLTTLLTIDTFSGINEEKRLDQPVTARSPQTDTMMQLVSLSAITQAWLAGLFIGKITRGVYSGGFLFSALFTAVTIVSIVIVQSHVIDINGIFMTQ